MEIEIMMAGIAGQGMQVSTVLLATAAMLEGKQVMHFGAYGGYQRNVPSEGTVIIGDSRLEQPPLVTQWSALIAMGFMSRGEVAFTSSGGETEPASEESATKTGFGRYGSKVKPGGLMVVNRSVIRGGIDRQDVSILEMPATEMAEQMGNRMLVSMIALGAFAEATALVTVKSLQSSLAEALPPHHQHHIPLNQKALDRGADFVRELRSNSDWNPGVLLAAATG